MWRLAVLVAIAACTEAEPPSEPGVTYLSPTEHLSRASMALRGTRPAIAELEAVDNDPSQLPRIVDGYLTSPEFGATIRDLHNEVFLLKFQIDGFAVPPVGPLAGRSVNEMRDSIYQEPLRLIEDVVMTDQPYTKIVTADYMMADPVVATVWGLPHSGEEAWERTARVDPTGPIGILGSVSLFLRYRTTRYNYNRGRANAIARGLVCHDFVDADIHLDSSVNLADPKVTAEAVVSNPSCAGCHQTLDPLASYFFGYFNGPLPTALVKDYPIDWYHNGRAWFSYFKETWLGTTNRPPGYFGREVFGLDGLGAAIAADPRFARCAAIHFASYLTERSARELSPTWIAELQREFTAGGYRAKQLARSIVLSDAFRIASVADPVRAEGVIGYQKVRPQQLHRMLLDLTGFAWRGASHEGAFDYLDDDRSGYRVLAGGIDSYFVTAPSHTMNASASLVARRAAALAAEYVVTHDATVALEERTLFSDVDAVDAASVRAQLALLHARIYGELVAPNDPDVDATYRLFEGARAASGSVRRAWTVTLTGMLSDLRALYY